MPPDDLYSGMASYLRGDKNQLLLIPTGLGPEVVMARYLKGVVEGTCPLPHPTRPPLVLMVYERNTSLQPYIDSLIDEGVTSLTVI
ncbi:hypothetical protein KIPB_010295, partial [Kipferlia bialata]|eukprot:g10295.t1